MSNMPAASPLESLGVAVTSPQAAKSSTSIQSSAAVVGSASSSRRPLSAALSAVLQSRLRSSGDGDVGDGFERKTRIEASSNDRNYFDGYLADRFEEIDEEEKSHANSIRSKRPSTSRTGFNRYHSRPQIISSLTLFYYILVVRFMFTFHSSDELDGIENISLPTNTITFDTDKESVKRLPVGLEEGRRRRGGVVNSLLSLPNKTSAPSLDSLAVDADNDGISLPAQKRDRK
jgi:hypothetical protein